MAKSKPTQVIVHRIEFQQHERELLEIATAAYAVRSGFAPLVTLFTSAEFLTFLTLLLESLGITDWLPDNLAETVGNWGKEGWAQFWSAADDQISRPSPEQEEQITQIQVEATRWWAVMSAMLSGIQTRVDN